VAAQSLSFDIFANDRASETFRRLGLAADNAAGDVKDLGDRLTKLGTRVTTARLELKGDKEAGVELDKLDVKLIRLGGKVANPSITVEGKIRALADIAAVDLAMDKLNAKHARPSLLSSLGGGLLGAAGAAGPGLGAAGIGVATAGMGALAVAAIHAGAALAAAGAGVAAFAALSVPQFTAISGALTKIQQDTDAYERATNAASKSLALKHIRQDWADISPPQRQAVHGIQALQAEFGKLSAKLAPITFKVFNEGLKIADKLLPDLLPFAKAAGNAIDGLLKSLDKFVTPASGAGLHGKLAAISDIPPPTGFQKFLTQLQSLTGPAITALGQGLGQIAVAVGKLILVAAKPDSIRTLSRVLGFLAAVINGVSWAINRASGNLQKWVDIAHQTANKFDEFRHDTARVFAAIAMIFDTARHGVATWGHDVAHTFDTLRHSVAVTWNALWAATIGTQIRALGTIVSWFRGLPDRVLGALRGLGHSLYGFAHAALSEFWDGFKAIGGAITGWLSNFWHGIVGIAKKILGVFSPSSVFYDIGKNLMLGLFHGVKDHAHRAVSAARGVGGAMSGALGGDALANQALARRIFPWGASQWPPFVSLVMAESGFNRFARNPSSGAYGIPQALPESKLPFAGQAAGGSHAGPQLSWMFNYIAGRYVTPAAAWAHELSAHWYGSGLSGGVFRSPTLIGVGDRPERVDITPLASPRGRGGGNTYNINVNVPPSANKADIGRQVVEVIREYERRSGPGWRRLWRSPWCRTGPRSPAPRPVVSAPCPSRCRWRRLRGRCWWRAWSPGRPVSRSRSPR
jgi:hypothetical protein